MEVKDNVMKLLDENLKSNDEQIRSIKIDIKFLSHNDYKNKLSLQRALALLESEKRSILRDMYTIDRDTRLKDRELEAKVAKYEAEADSLNKQKGIDKVGQVLDAITNMARGSAIRSEEEDGEE